MSWVRRVGGVLLALVGIVWGLQGVGVIPGSFMTGQAFWAVMGVICLATGVFLVLRPGGRAGT